MKYPLIKKSGWTLLETLIAIVVIGIGTGVYMRMQGMTGGVTKSNSNLFKAGQMIEKHIEGIRVQVAMDQTNWIPGDITVLDPPLKLVRTVSNAYSPKAPTVVVADVRKVDLVVSWGNKPMDTLKVTTYVSKKF